LIRQVQLNKKACLRKAGNIIVLKISYVSLQVRLLDSLEEYTSARQQKEEEKRQSRVSSYYTCNRFEAFLVISIFKHAVFL